MIYNDCLTDPNKVDISNKCGIQDCLNKSNSKCTINCGICTTIINGNIGPNINLTCYGGSNTIKYYEKYSLSFLRCRCSDDQVGYSCSRSILIILETINWLKLKYFQLVVAYPHHV